MKAGVIDFLASRTVPVASLRQAGLARALTAEEREWLEAVPAVPVVEFAGMRSTWVRTFFCGWVRHALERGAATVERADGVLVARMPAGIHRVQLDAAGHAEPPPVRRWPRRERSFFYGSTHASRTHQD